LETKEGKVLGRATHKALNDRIQGGGRKLGGKKRCRWGDRSRNLQRKKKKRCPPFGGLRQVQEEARKRCLE